MKIVGNNTNTLYAFHYTSEYVIDISTNRIYSLFIPLEKYYISNA